MTVRSTSLGCSVCGRKGLLGSVDRDGHTGPFRCYYCWQQVMEMREAANSELPLEQHYEIVPWPDPNPDPRERILMWCRACGSRRLLIYATINKTRKGWVEIEASDDGGCDLISGVEENDYPGWIGDDLACCATCGKMTTVREARRGW